MFDEAPQYEGVEELSRQYLNAHFGLGMVSLGDWQLQCFLMGLHASCLGVMTRTVKIWDVRISGLECKRSLGIVMVM